MRQSIEILLGRDDDGRRADRIVRRALNKLSLSTIYRLFRQSRIKIGTRSISPEDRLASGDILLVFLPGEGNTNSVRDEAQATAQEKQGANIFDATSLRDLQDAPRMLWQSEDLVAFHKPRGMLTHDGAASLEAFARDALRGSIPPSASFSPGPLHRLDRNTSGLIMFSKSRIGAERFSTAMREHRLRKMYVALASGMIETEAVLEDNLIRDRSLKKTRAGDGGRSARLRIVPLAHGEEASLVLIELYTGLTHQIRAQLAARGNPLCGDVKYGGAAKSSAAKAAFSSGYLLHAHSLLFPAPFFPGMPDRISDPLPADFASRALEALRLGERLSRPWDADSEKAWKSSIEAYILSAIEATI